MAHFLKLCMNLMRLWIYVCPNTDYIDDRTVEALPKPLIPERASSTFLSTDNLHSQRINTMGRHAFYSRSTPISIHLEQNHVWLYGVRIVKRTLWILDTYRWLSLLGHFTITYSVASVKHRSFLTCVLLRWFTQRYISQHYDLIDVEFKWQCGFDRCTTSSTHDNTYRRHTKQECKASHKPVHFITTVHEYWCSPEFLCRFGWTTRNILTNQGCATTAAGSLLGIRAQ